jgi:molybdenum cofactor cytidylyltransferase
VVAAVVLAAGGSRRLGRPKQLLRVGGRPLVRRAADAVRDGGCAPVVVVLGAEAGAVRAALVDAAVETIENERWSEGVASSIRAGIAAVEPLPAVQSVLLVACDQVKLDAAVVRRILGAFDGTAGRMVACAYAGTVGAPALFERSRFRELAELAGDRGAKPILLRHADALLRLPWPEGAVEVDTAEDAHALDPGP